MNVDKNQPWALVLLSSNNQQLGYVKLTGTIESIPMYYLRENTTTINLGSLSKNGTEFSPSISPLQSSIPLSETEKTVIGQSDDWFAASVKNLDIDANGTLDFTENKDYKIGVLYFINGGVFTNSTIPTVDSSGLINGFKLFVHINEPTLPSEIYVTGPIGSGLQNTLTTEKNNYGNYVDFFTPLVPNTFPPGGEYSVQYLSKNLMFNIPDQSYILNNIVIPYPIVTLNNNGTINKIQWEMRLPLSNQAINPSSLISKIQVQIDGTGTPCQNYVQPNFIYISPQLSAETITHTLECQNIQWTNVQRIYITYWDQYNQHYVVIFQKNN